MKSASRSSCERIGGSPTTATRPWIGARPTSLTDAKGRAGTRSSKHTRRQRRTRSRARSVPSRRTGSKVGVVVCPRPQLGLSVIANATRGVGDGPQPHRFRIRQAVDAPTVSPCPGQVGVSHAAIAAVLIRDDLSAGERLVAWSLASFANREHRARPRIPGAPGRAGWSRCRYLELRDRLARRGLLEIETHGVGRGHASTAKVLFAQSARGATAR